MIFICKIGPSESWNIETNTQIESFVYYGTIAMEELQGTPEQHTDSYKLILGPNDFIKHWKVDVDRNQ